MGFISEYIRNWVLEKSDLVKRILGVLDVAIKQLCIQESFFTLLDRIYYYSYESLSWLSLLTLKKAVSSVFRTVLPAIKYTFSPGHWGVTRRSESGKEKAQL